MSFQHLSRNTSLCNLYWKTAMKEVKIIKAKFSCCFSAAFSLSFYFTRQPFCSKYTCPTSWGRKWAKYTCPTSWGRKWAKYTCPTSWGRKWAIYTCPTSSLVANLLNSFHLKWLIGPMRSGVVNFLSYHICMYITQCHCNKIYLLTFFH